MLIDKPENKHTEEIILGKKFFTTVVPVIEKSAVRFNYKIHIFDTPDIFDKTKSDDDIQISILKCICQKSSGPLAIILVFNIANYTEEVEKSVKHFVDIFGEKIFQYCIVLFTRKDDNDDERCVDVSRYIENAPPALRTLIDKCGGRKISFDIRPESNKRNEQVNNLFLMISDINNDKNNRNEIYERAKNLVCLRESQNISRRGKQLNKRTRRAMKK